VDQFSADRLAKMAKISVRTLHYYDEIGLLKPAYRADSGYRYYTKNELLRLQQILFYKELGFQLAAIQQALDEPDFDMEAALMRHKQELHKRIRQMNTLMDTIDNTILDIKNKRKMVSYEEMYEGFSKEEVEQYEKEVTEKWGQSRLEETKRNIQAMSRQEWDDLKAEGNNIYIELTKLMDGEPEDAAVQSLIARHHIMTGKYYDCPVETYRGLAEMYVSDERFIATFDSFRPGLSDFLHDAIHHYCYEREAQA
jgi:DNA-binding transcriptional MerR regulator